TVRPPAPRGAVAASLSRKRLTWLSRGTCERARCRWGGWLQAEGVLRRDRPAGELQTVNAEERDRQTVHSKRDAARMRQGAVLALDAPGDPEVLAVVVEAHARGRLRARV